jgi:hypothetical protein
MRGNRALLVKMTQLDWLAVCALVCFALAATPLVPAVVANSAGTVLCFPVLGVIWSGVLIGERTRAMNRVIAATACALAAGALGGLLLNFLPAGLDRTNWLLLGGVLTLVGYVIARWRGAVRLIDVDALRGVRPSFASGAKLAGIAVALAATAVVSVHSVNVSEPEFTELWLVPIGALNTPIRASQATMGVKSHEARAEQFTIVLDTGATSWKTEVTLEPGQTWTKDVYLEGERAQASLYQGSDVAAAPYRTVWVARG